MATIRLRGKSYRVEVCSFGQRSSRTFDTHDEAVAWGRQQEDAFGKNIIPPEPHQITAARPHLAALILSRDQVLGLPDFDLVCGIYFLLKAGEIVYVGQSVNVHARVAAHLRMWPDIDGGKYLRCTPDDLQQLEAYYIRTLSPRLNIQHIAA